MSLNTIIESETIGDKTFYVVDTGRQSNRIECGVRGSTAREPGICVSVKYSTSTGNVRPGFHGTFMYDVDQLNWIISRIPHLYTRNA